MDSFSCEFLARFEFLFSSLQLYLFIFNMEKVARGKKRPDDTSGFSLQIIHHHVLAASLFADTKWLRRFPFAEIFTLRRHKESFNVSFYLVDHSSNADVFLRLLA